MDALVEHLLADIAVEGERGMPLPALEASLRSFEEARAAAAARPAQMVDEAYTNYVWRQLRQRRDVCVGAAVEPEQQALKMLASGKLHEGMMDVKLSAAVAPAAAAAPPPPPPPPPKGKKAPRPPAIIGTVDVDDKGTTLDIAELKTQHGDALRFTLDRKSLYTRLWGSDDCPPLTWAVVQLTMRAREEGITFQEVGKLIHGGQAVMDSKTVFHHFKKPLQKETVLKYSTLIQVKKDRPAAGSAMVAAAGSAVVASRFKEQCAAYLAATQGTTMAAPRATRTSNEGEDEDAQAADEEDTETTDVVALLAAEPYKLGKHERERLEAELEEEAEDEPEEDADVKGNIVARAQAPVVKVEHDVEGVMGYAPLPPALTKLLLTRLDLLRRRIARLCEVSTGGLLLRARLTERLGLRGRPSRRAAGAAWRVLVSRGLLELVNAHIKKKDAESTASVDVELCLRLTPAGEAWLADERRGADERANEQVAKRLAAELERHRMRSIAVEVPFERQMLEVICAAGTRGTTLLELKKHFGTDSPAKQRSLAALLLQMQVSGRASAYDDTTLIAATDQGSGRTKELRYWSRPAHLALMRSNALFDDETQAKFVEPQALHDFTNATPVQEWTDVEERIAAVRVIQRANLGSVAQHRPASEKKSKKARVNPIDPVTGVAKRGRPRKTPAEKASTSRGSAEKQAKKDATAAAKAAKKEPKKLGRPKKVPDPNVPPPEPKKKGRPRKPDSELSKAALARRKRQEKADAAAAAAGQAPEDEQAEEEEEEADSTMAAQAGPSSAGPSREAAPVEQPAAPAAADVPDEEQAGDAAEAPPPPAKRTSRARTKEEPQERSSKRARRSKLAPAEEEAAAAAVANDPVPQIASTSGARDVEMPPVEAPAQPVDGPSQSAEAAASTDEGAPVPSDEASADAELPASAADAPATPARRNGTAKARKSQSAAPANFAKRRRALLLATFLEQHKFISAIRAAGALRNFLIERGDDDFTMFDDTKTRRSTFQYLEERGTAKSVTLAIKQEGVDSPQQKVYYHASTSDDELAAYAKEFLRKGLGAPAQQHALDEDVDEIDRPAGMPRRQRQVDPFHNVDNEDLLRDPQYRKQFDDEVTCSQPQGYLSGGMARLKQLHLAVMGIFEADNSVADGDEIDAALVSHAEGVIDVEQLRLASLPVRELLKLVPSEPSPQLTAVAESADEKARTAAQLGGEIEEWARRDSSRKAFDALLRDLQLLDLAQPVRMHKDKAVALPAGEQPESKLWQFHRSDRRLVGFVKATSAPQLLPSPKPLSTVIEARRFWTLIRGAPEVVAENADADADDADPEIVELARRMRKNHAWSRNYQLSPLQTRFLARFDAEMVAEQMPEQRLRNIAEVARVPLHVAVEWYSKKAGMQPLDESHPLFDARSSKRAKTGPDGTVVAAVKKSRAMLTKQRDERRERTEQWDAKVAQCLAAAGVPPDDPQHELLTLTLYTSSMHGSWIKGTGDVQLDSLAQIIDAAREAPVTVKGEGAARRQSEAQAKAARKRAARAMRQAEAKAARERAGGKRKRVVRSNVAWTPARDDDLRDAVAVIRVRDVERGNKPNGRQQMTALQQLFPGHQMQNISTRLRFLAKMVGEEAYMDELQNQWALVYQRLRADGVLRDQDSSSADAFDLPQHVRLLQATVNKANVYSNIEAREAEALPIDTAPLREEMREGERLPEDLPETVWDAATTHDIAASAVVRARFIKGQPFTLRRAGPETKPISAAEGVARAIVRMHLDMDEDDKKGLVAGMESMAVELGGSIDKAIEDLTKAKQIRLERAPTDDADLSNMRARRPGSNYVWCAEASATNAFGELDLAAVARAQAEAERKPLTEVRPDVDDNEAAALVMLLSEHRIAPAALDMKQLRMATRGLFNAKRLSDEELELLLPLAPVVKPEPDELMSESVEPPEHAVLAWCADGEEDWEDVSQRIAQAWTAAARTSRRDGTLVERLASLLKSAGEAGATREAVEAAFADASQAQLQRVMRVPLHAEPPLAFLAGYNEARLVHAQYLQAWTVRALSAEAAVVTPEPEAEKLVPGRRRRKKATPQPTDVPTEEAARLAAAATAALRARARTLGPRFFPRVWLDLRGQRSAKGRWQQGVRSVVTTVLERPGVPVSHLVSLFAQASRTGLAYDRLEVAELLGAACATGVLAQHLVRADGLRSSDALGAAAPEELFCAPHEELCLFPTGRDWSLCAAAGLQ